MIPSDHSELIELTHSYLSQQAEIYGEDLYVDRSVVKRSDETPNNLAELEKSIQKCQKCGLSKTRRKLVFGVGNPRARLMLIGEAPGEEEDNQGKPFVGKAGQLLDKILVAVGFCREEVYIGNILKCRPPGNRDPLPEEVVFCMPFLLKQIETIQPQIILALGRIAGQNLLNKIVPLHQLRSVVHEFHGIPLMVTFHPAALLRNPQWKKPTWEDVQQIRHLYDEIVGDKPAWNPQKKK